MGMIAGAHNLTTAKERFAPASSFLETVEYDPLQRTMDITFKTGAKHRYFQIYPSTFLAFKQSPSHSTYYARAIKGNLAGSKIISADIGRKDSTPLKHDAREHHLDRGIKEQRTRKQEQFGTAHRAFSNAAID